MVQEAPPKAPTKRAEDLVRAFCPACWRMLSASDSRCQECGAEIDALSSRPYATKLLAALDHPIGEVRERAAQILGEVGERDAREPLIRIATESRDPYLATTALKSLARLLERFPDLPPIDWTQFVRPELPITVRVAAIEVYKREFARGRRQETRG
jgi:HEAT repeat protein